MGNFFSRPRSRSSRASKASLLKSVEVTSDGGAPAKQAGKKKGTTPWWEVKLDDIVVVRKEIRKMSAGEQKRYAAALNKMKENTTGKGTSMFYKLALLHGGMSPLSRNEAPEYCAHRRECFPHWHRPYLLDFEHALRRADMALGGDGNIGLPYWNWSETTVNGEVFPKIVRDECMAEFEYDFFPVTPDPGHHNYKMSATKSDAAIKSGLLSAGGGRGIGKLASDCLLSHDHKQHASTAYTGRSHPRAVSLESPHNSVHGIVGGIMNSFQSSFHPIFWLHHNNVDRIFEGYLRENPDSASEFERHQQTRPPDGKPGFPQGPWGPYKPFKHPKTGEPFHARDTFDCRALGFDFDELPTAGAPNMREPPFLAIFLDVNVTRMGMPRTCYVYVRDRDTPWSPPPTIASGSGVELDREAVMAHAAFAGTGSIFFIDNPRGCSNCMSNPTFDLKVDVTDALRGAKIHPRRVVLDVMVEGADGSFLPLEQTPVPPPALHGPKLGSGKDFSEGSADNDAEDVKDFQSHMLTAELLLDGVCGEKTGAAIKEFQAAVGIKADGVVGPKTRRMLGISGLAKPSSRFLKKFELGADKKVTWSLDVASVPPSLQNGDAACTKLLAEAQKAFDLWAEPTGITFEQLEEGGEVVLAFADRSAANDSAFDGPGGALADASNEGITFDSSESWELMDVQHKDRAKLVASEAGDAFWADASIFKFLIVALHEVGHVIGLGHTKDPKDVMSPYYVAGQTSLSDADKARAKELYS